MWHVLNFDPSTKRATQLMHSTCPTSIQVSWNTREQSCAFKSSPHNVVWVTWRTLIIYFYFVYYWGQYNYDIPSKSCVRRSRLLRFDSRAVESCSFSREFSSSVRRHLVSIFVTSKEILVRLRRNSCHDLCCWYPALTGSHASTSAWTWATLKLLHVLVLL